MQILNYRTPLFRFHLAEPGRKRALCGRSLRPMILDSQTVPAVYCKRCVTVFEAEHKPEPARIAAVEEDRIFVVL